MTRDDLATLRDELANIAENIAGRAVEAVTSRA